MPINNQAHKNKVSIEKKITLLYYQIFSSSLVKKNHNSWLNEVNDLKNVKLVITNDQVIVNYNNN